MRMFSMFKHLFFLNDNTFVTPLHTVCQLESLYPDVYQVNGNVLADAHNNSFNNIAHFLNHQHMPICFPLN